MRHCPFAVNVTEQPTPTIALLASIESSLHWQLLEDEELLEEDELPNEELEELLGCPPELCEDELEFHDDELVLEEDEPVLEEGKGLEELLTSYLVRAMREEI